MMRGLCIGIGVLTLTFALGCGGGGDETTISKADAVKDGKADGPSMSKMCAALKQAEDCDLCEAAKWYSDGTCDDFCANPDPDCQTVEPSEEKFCFNNFSRAFCETGKEGMNEEELESRTPEFNAACCEVYGSVDGDGENCSSFEPAFTPTGIAFDKVSKPLTFISGYFNADLGDVTDVSRQNILARALVWAQDTYGYDCDGVVLACPEFTEMTVADYFALLRDEQDDWSEGLKLAEIDKFEKWVGEQQGTIRVFTFRGNSDACGGAAEFFVTLMWNLDSGFDFDRVVYLLQYPYTD